MLGDPHPSTCKYFLIEAHHFGELKFREHADYMVISPEGLADRSLWPTIVKNARKFAEKQGIRIYQTD